MAENDANAGKSHGDEDGSVNRVVGNDGDDGGVGSEDDQADLSATNGTANGSSVAVIVAVAVVVLAVVAAALFVYKKRKQQQHDAQVRQRAATLELMPVAVLGMVQNPLRASTSSSSSSSPSSSARIGGVSRSGTYLTPVANNPEYQTSGSDGTTVGSGSDGMQGNGGYEVAVTRNPGYYGSITSSDARYEDLCAHTHQVLEIVALQLLSASPLFSSHPNFIYISTHPSVFPNCLPRNLDATPAPKRYSEPAPSLGDYAEAARLHTYAEVGDGNGSSVEYATPFEFGHAANSGSSSIAQYEYVDALARGTAVADSAV